MEKGVFQLAFCLAFVLYGGFNSKQVQSMGVVVLAAFSLVLRFASLCSS